MRCFGKAFGMHLWLFMFPFSSLEDDTGQNGQHSLNPDLLYFSHNEVCALCLVVILTLLIPLPIPSQCNTPWQDPSLYTRRCEQESQRCNRNSKDKGENSLPRNNDENQ